MASVFTIHTRSGSEEVRNCWWTASEVLGSFYCRATRRSEARFVIWFSAPNLPTSAGLFTMHSIMTTLKV